MSGAADRTESRKRLSVCILAYKDLGANTRVARQAATLAAVGHRVTVISFAEPDLELAPALGEVRFIATGVPAVGPQLSRLLKLARRLPGTAADLGLAAAASWGSARGRTRCQLFAEWAVRATIGERFDVVQAHFDKALIAADAVRRQCGGQLVFDAVEVPFDGEKLPAPRDMRALRRAEISRETAIARTAALWLTVGQALANEIAARMGIDPPVVIRNCCARASGREPDRLREDIELPADSRLIVALNSFRPNDGLETVVDALALLPKNVHLAVLGTPARGAGAEMLLGRAASAGTRERVHFPPLQPPSRLVAYLAGADMGVVPLRPITANLRVALPNRLFELIAAGLPVAVSRIADIAALVTQFGAGQVYDEDDPHAAAASIAAILDQSARYREATASAARGLTWEGEGSLYRNAIEELADREL